MRSCIAILLLSSAVKAASLFDEDNAQFILRLHNQLRKKHDAPPLKWSSLLAQESKDYVETCDYYKNKVHPNATNNVALGYSDWYETIQGWYSEHEHYDFDNPRYVQDAGTFIAMVWRSSTHLGCASFDCGEKLGRLYQCQYSPSLPLSLVFTKKEYTDNVHEPTGLKIGLL